MRLFVYRLSFLILGLFAVVTAVYAQNADLENKIKEYQQKLTEIRNQKNTLGTQIQEMDTKIYLTGLTIQQTEKKIIDTEAEIEKLTSRIGNLDTSLDTLSKLLLHRIVQGYKTKSVSLFQVLLNTDSVSELTNTIKYQQTTQASNQKLLVQVQEAKLSYEEQKTLRETKKTELDQLVVSLNNQKQQLKNQQAQKQKLLIDTNNDEVTYQTLLAQAEAQLKGFKTFVQSTGYGEVISANQFGSGSDGAYFSQRDERWAYQRIGYSYENVLDVGCLITSIAMFGKKYGQDVTPSTLAADPSRFWGNTAFMNNPWASIAGRKYQSLTIAQIDAELQSGNPVIVGVLVNNCAYGGNHFVLLTKKEGNTYIMHDPIYGPDKKFTDHYSTICSAATFK